MPTTPEVTLSELVVTSTSGKQFPVTYPASITRGLLSHFINCPLQAFGVPASLDKAQHPTLGQVDVLTISSASVAKSTVEAFFGRKIPKGTNARIQLSPETVAAIEAGRQAALGPYQAEAAELLASVEAERQAMPRQHVFEFGYDLGDYSSKTYCRVIAIRRPTAREHAHYLQSFAERPGSYSQLVDGQWVPHTTQSWAASAEQVYHLAEVVTQVPPQVPLVEELRSQARCTGIILSGGYDLFPVTEAQVQAARQLQLAHEAAEAEKQQVARQNRERQLSIEQERDKDIPAGHARCWECGCVHSTKQMTYDAGAGWYCGC